MPSTPPAEMVNVILVGGKFGGLKTRVPEGMNMLNIPDVNKTPELAIVQSHADLQKHMEKAASERLVNQGVQTIEDCDNPYMLWPCVVTLPTLNDVVSFTIGAPPGTKMSDAFMQIVAGYCMMCRPDDYEEEEITELPEDPDA